MELTLTDYRFMRLPPSMIAAVGIFSARRMLDRDWHVGLLYYSRFAAEQLIPAADLLYSKLLGEDDGHYFWRKYEWFTNSHARAWVAQMRSGSDTAAAVAADYASSILAIKRDITPLL